MVLSPQRASAAAKSITGLALAWGLFADEPAVAPTPAADSAFGFFDDAPGAPSTAVAEQAYGLFPDAPGAPQVGVTLQETFAQAGRFWLFEDTEWQAMQEQGPVLVDLRTCPALADLYRVDGQRWRGMLMYSEASASTLLAHSSGLYKILKQSRH